MRGVQEETSKLRPATKRKELYGTKMHLKSSKNAHYVGLNASQTGNNNPYTIVCYILVSKENQDWVKIIWDNKKMLDEIIKKWMDFVLVGYDEKGNFDEACFYSFIEKMQSETKWKWQDKAQIIMVKMDKSDSIMKYTDGHMFTVYIEEALKFGYAKTLTELVQKMVIVAQKSNSVNAFISNIRRNYRAHKMLHFITDNKWSIICAAGERGLTLFQWFLGGN